MDCTNCRPKSCRKSGSCGNEKFNKELVLKNYSEPENQKIIQGAASLVNNGKAGTLSRLQEIITFIKLMKYKKVGLAYCYGMESDAKHLKETFKSKGIGLQTVSCTVGAINQNEIDTTSCTEKVSCNPVGQACQLNSESVDFVLIMGICLGHDILLQKNLKADFTTFVVKDRVFAHAPLKALY
jgi:Uncharacterized metal-binding protein conserved in archaea